MEKTSEYCTLLRAHGLRATPQRQILLAALSKAKEPMSSTELHVLAGTDAMDATTFYRGLETLVSVGLVRKVNLQHAHIDYELIRKGEHHHHIVCRHCEKIETVLWCPEKKIEKKILEKTGFATLSEHAIEFFGVCKKCI